MKAFFLTITILAGLHLNGQADYKTNFLKKWKNAAEYTLECAQAMPEDLYDYKPTEEAMTFKQQLLHMVSNMMRLSSGYMEGPKHNFDLKDQSHTKAEVIEIIEKTFAMSTEAVENFPEEKMSDVVNFFAGPMEVQQIMMLMTDHMTHHRGQILVYMRINGVKAPKYRGW